MCKFLFSSLIVLSDMCFMTKKSSDLLKCVPSSTLLNTNTSVLMWPDRKCDGTSDCLQGEDEVECGMSGNRRYNTF